MFFAQSCGHAKFQVWILEICLFEKKEKKGTRASEVFLCVLPMPGKKKVNVRM